MTDLNFMHLVIQKSTEKLAEGNLPLFSIIVKDNKIIAEASAGSSDFDPSAHNDLNCIRLACKNLQNFSLTDCTLYTTIEPCLMCLSAAVWASLSRIVFGAFQEDIPQNSYGTINYHALDCANKFTTPPDIFGGLLRAEAKQLMKNVKNWTL